MFSEFFLEPINLVAIGCNWLQLGCNLLFWSSIFFLFDTILRQIFDLPTLKLRVRSMKKKHNAEKIENLCQMWSLGFHFRDFVDLNSKQHLKKKSFSAHAIGYTVRRF